MTVFAKYHPSIEKRLDKLEDTVSKLEVYLPPNAEQLFPTKGMKTEGVKSLLGTTESEKIDIELKIWREVEDYKEVVKKKSLWELESLYYLADTPGRGASYAMAFIEKWRDEKNKESNDAIQRDTHKHTV